MCSVNLQRKVAFLGKLKMSVNDEGKPEVKYTKIFINNEWVDSGMLSDLITSRSAVREGPACISNQLIPCSCTIPQLLKRQLGVMQSGLGVVIV